jgi:ubiquinone biosynthesis protein
LIDLLGAVVDKDSQKLTKTFVRICAKKQSEIDLKKLERSVMELLDRYHSIAIDQMNIGNFLISLLALLRNFQLKLPSEYIIMIKALVTADGAARLAYPDLNVVEEVKGLVHSISRKRYSPENLWKNIKRSFGNILAVKKELPLQLVSIVEKIEQGDLGITFRLEQMARLVDSLENASNRLTIGIITGAIIMGSSMIITTGVEPFLFGYPALGVIGYLISVVLGLWLVITILRNKKY